MDFLFVTHAHMDHIGRIPKLVAEGFKGKIFSTIVTLEISKLMFEDALRIMEFNKKKYGEDPLYKKEDVDNAFRLWETMDYYKEEDVSKDVNVVLTNSGHILGSSMFEFKINDKKILFTGDLGNDASALLKPTDKISDIDYLVIDSVYGDRVHEPIEESRKRFTELILNTIKKNGVVMIPAFSLDRTQEILYLLNNLVESKVIPSIPIYLDSPLGISVTEIYERIKKNMSKEALEQIAGGDNIFDFPKLKFTRNVRESKSISRESGSKIVIAGSGMSTGGRILHHEKRYLSDTNNTLLLVGHQAIGTLGRELEEGANMVEIHGDKISVKAHIEKIQGFSAHKDSDGLIDFVSQTEDTIKNVFVVSGEPKSSLVLIQRIRDYLGVKAEYPKIGNKYYLK